MIVTVRVCGYFSKRVPGQLTMSSVALVGCLFVCRLCPDSFAFLNFSVILRE